MNLIDANVFIRYLTGDDASKQQSCTYLFEPINSGREDAFTTHVVIHEVCYILSASSHYNLTHQDIRNRLYPLLNMRHLHVSAKSICLEALDIFTMGEKIDFSDALSVAYVRNGLTDGIYSFDRKMDTLPGANRREP